MHQTVTSSNDKGFFTDLISLKDLLESNYKPNTENKSSPFETLYQKSLIDTLCGAIELHLSIYLPLLDPVEKNRLKTEYCKEDIDYLQRQVFAYEHLACVMNYSNLFGETKAKINDKLLELKTKLEKLSKKVALRPVDSPGQTYTSLVQELNHFMTSCCTPKALLDLTLAVMDCQKDISTTKTKEVQQRINLFLSNVAQFILQFTTKFGIYYKDFVMPVVYSTNLLRTGFSGLHDYLRVRVKEIRHSTSTGVTYNINRNDSLHKLTSNLIAFPSTEPLKLTGADGMVTLLTDLDHNDALLCKLVQANLFEIRNSVVIAGEVDTEIFVKLTEVLELCYQMWQKQDEMKKKKQEEEDSLYVTK